MRRITLVSVGAAVGLLGCETFISLGEDYTQECTTLTTVYQDADKDGEGNKHEPITWCGESPAGYVTNALDCNDDSPDVNTRAASDDQCDGIDQDCDGRTDEDFPVLDCTIPITDTESCQGRTKCEGADVLCFARYFLDRDGDGYGREERLVETAGSCGEPPAVEGGVWVAEGNDCDDDAPTVYPNAVELCDEVDQNCNGTVGRVYLRQTFSTGVLNAGAAEERWGSGTNSGFVQAAPGGAGCKGPEDDVTSTDDGSVVGVGLGACVSPGTSGELESPIMDTTGALDLRLVFHEWVDFTPEGTRGVPPTVTLAVQQGSTRTTLFTLVRPGPTSLQPTPGWAEVEFRLNTVTGSNMSLVWSYESGDAVGWGGYAIDDVLLVDEDCKGAL
ncbi:putative metal-binding motif-containing protein [Polyangium mundeleinium]|uniref:Metal-binding motif-containing protein n=1 Tax=Polyangium mundeleinium TaxID=2995306 RepID=A0ABT5EKM3_9BACT|nr:putative metal-binding motif-containing protein [Polyangium mundeleinium]MDC0742014.1 putative metal-binding motif-containing protein [Polyangium mundeleinium]